VSDDDIPIFIAVDPGNEKSGVIRWFPDEDAVGAMQLVSGEIMPNEKLEALLVAGTYDVLLIETPKARGKPTSNEEMETLVWIGRFFHCAIARSKEWSMVWRNDVKMFLCNATAKITDANIRAALIDYFGGEAAAIGGKGCKSCAGVGSRPGGEVTCPVCDGTGREPGKKKGTTKKCEKCHGKKNVRGERIACEACAGEGQTEPGPLHRITADMLAATAVAVTWLNNPVFVHRILTGTNAEMAVVRKAKSEARKAKAAAKLAAEGNKLEDPV
jgi:hypothetical protein